VNDYGYVKLLQSHPLVSNDVVFPLLWKLDFAGACLSNEAYYFCLSTHLESLDLLRYLLDLVRVHEPTIQRIKWPFPPQVPKLDESRNLRCKAKICPKDHSVSCLSTEACLFV